MQIWVKNTLFIFCLISIFFVTLTVFAQTSNSIDSVDVLQDELSVRKSQIEQINKRISEYKTRISQYSNESASLQNDIAMIENQVVLTQLDIEQTQIEISAQELEIKIINEEIVQAESTIDRQISILKELIFELNQNESVGLVEVLFGADDFNELFSEFEDLQSVNDDLRTALDETKDTKNKLANKKSDQESSLELLISLQDELEIKVGQLEYQANAKETLVAKTQESEAQYRVLMSELRAEQQSISNEILALQSKLEGELTNLDALGDSTVMSWPLHGIITAVFHDPTYPFRHLFEHSGLDIAVPTGTPVVSSAPGYVAWAKTGSSYGNYVMVIHAGGYATLYAHLSSISVSQDQFVSRGQVIGYSGNTGFSTGPHLHFEVRQNGIPVNPQQYLSAY